MSVLHTKGIQSLWRYTRVVIRVSGWAGGDVQVIVVGPAEDTADDDDELEFHSLGAFL